MTELALDGSFDHLLIESTGISEPMPVAQTFLFEDMKTGVSLGTVARLDTLVTVVDAGAWAREHNSGETLAQRKMEAGRHGPLPHQSPRPPRRGGSGRSL